MASHHVPCAEDGRLSLSENFSMLQSHAEYEWNLTRSSASIACAILMRHGKIQRPEEKRNVTTCVGHFEHYEIKSCNIPQLLDSFITVMASTAFLQICSCERSDSDDPYPMGLRDKSCREFELHGMHLEPHLHYVIFLLMCCFNPHRMYDATSRTLLLVPSNMSHVARMQAYRAKPHVHTKNLFLFKWNIGAFIEDTFPWFKKMSSFIDGFDMRTIDFVLVDTTTLPIFGHIFHDTTTLPIFGRIFHTKSYAEMYDVPIILTWSLHRHYLMNTLELNTGIATVLLCLRFAKRRNPTLPRISPYLIMAHILPHCKIHSYFPAKFSGHSPVTFFDKRTLFCGIQLTNGTQTVDS